MLSAHCNRLNDMNLYVSDMDGTLLGDDSQVSATTASILNRLMTQNGLLFTVATARTPATVVPLMQQVQARLPFIVLSGAALWNVQENRFEQVHAIPVEVVDRVADVFERHGLHPLIYRNHADTMIYTHHCGQLSASEAKFVAERQHLPLKRFILDDSDYRHSPDEAMLIFAMNDYPTLERVYNEIAESIPCSPMLYCDSCDPSVALLEVYAQGCSKAAAIRRLATKVGAERIVVFGDNRNDLAMFQAAHTAIAVENAVPEIKAVADIIIGPNTSDSVARWLSINNEQ